MIIIIIIVIKIDKHHKNVFRFITVVLKLQKNEGLKLQMPRWNATIPKNTTIHRSTNTATADARIHDFCTAITMQCFSYATKSQSVLTCSEILTYLLLSSQLWIALPSKNSRLPVTAINHKVSTSCHNSRSQLRIKLSESAQYVKA